MTDGVQLGFAALLRTARAHAAALERLVPLVRELAARHPEGITVADVREAAQLQGQGRALSYLGAVMQAAGLVPTGRYRRSSIPASHGNLHQVWRAGTEEQP